MTRETIANVTKEQMGRKLACLVQQNKFGKVAWLFFRSTWLDNPKEGKETRRQIVT